MTMMASHDLDPQTIRPLGQKVLVRRLDKEEVSRGGVLLPKSRGERNMFCEVIRVGPGTQINQHDGTRKLVPACLKAQPGDVVAVRQFEGEEINPLKGDNYMLIDGVMIMGVRTVKPE